MGESRVDFIEGKQFNELDVNISPLLFLPCGHFYTIDTMDGIMELDKVYYKNSNYEWTGTAIY